MHSETTGPELFTCFVILLGFPSAPLLERAAHCIIWISQTIILLDCSPHELSVSLYFKMSSHHRSTILAALVFLSLPDVGSIQHSTTWWPEPSFLLCTTTSMKTRKLEGRRPRSWTSRVLRTENDRTDPKMKRTESLPVADPKAKSYNVVPSNSKFETMIAVNTARTAKQRFPKGIF